MDGNICNEEEYRFSPSLFSIRLKTIKHISQLKNTRDVSVMQLKDMVRVMKNYDYLNHNLPVKYFKEFLVQFYRIFKSNVDEKGFIMFITEDFVKLVDQHMKPKVHFPVDIHSEFLEENHALAFGFIAKFETFAFLEYNDDQVKSIALKDHLNEKENELENVVKNYQDGFPLPN